MTTCPFCANEDRNKCIEILLEERYGTGKITAILCLDCGLVFVDKITCRFILADWNANSNA